MKTSTPEKQPAQHYFEIRKNEKTGYKSLFAKQDLATGTVLSKIEHDKILEAPNRYTLQLGENRHIELLPEYLRYTNHSCSPNAFFDTTKMELAAVKNIKSGEEITFFYPSTEWDMEEPFACSCGSENCLGQIEGAGHLRFGQLSGYRLSEYVGRKSRLLEKGEVFPK